MIPSGFGIPVPSVKRKQKVIDNYQTGGNWYQTSKFNFLRLGTFMFEVQIQVQIQMQLKHVLLGKILGHDMENL